MQLLRYFQYLSRYVLTLFGNEVNTVSTEYDNYYNRMEKKEAQYYYFP